MMEGLHGHRKRDSVGYISSTVRKKMNAGLSVSLIFVMSVRAHTCTHRCPQRPEEGVCWSSYRQL